LLFPRCKKSDGERFPLSFFAKERFGLLLFAQRAKIAIHSFALCKKEQPRAIRSLLFYKKSEKVDSLPKRAKEQIAPLCKTNELFAGNCMEQMPNPAPKLPLLIPI